ncbi:MAG: PEP-CTERM sorting domain-containing protein, partial [Phycisphaerae bacterium]|nr:PEP-CTERM sorting domain-containing protein [Phycisphaerae bacterium]
TLTTQVSQSTGNLVLFLDFNFTSAPFEGNSTAIWENLRMEYTPEPAMMGLLGLGGLPLLLRRRR